jgi:Ankyrin repeats (many copies)
MVAAIRGHEAVLKLLLHKDGIQPELRDTFGRTALTDARKRGNLHIARLLRQKQGDNSVVHDEDESSGRHQEADQGRVFCNICLGFIPNANYHYHCGKCDRGDFDACQECIESGASCFDGSHALVRRIVEDGNLVEVADQILAIE